MNYSEKPEAPETRDSLDRYLDRALSAYSSVEPRQGLEQRVLARVRSAPAKRRWWIWLAVPALAALVALAILSRRPTPSIQPATAQKQTQATPLQQSAIQQQPDTVVTKNAGVRVRQRREHAVVAVNRQPMSLPKLPTFPSAQPLSNQERLLVALVRNHPEQLSEIAAWQKKFTKPPQPEALNPEEDGE